MIPAYNERESLSPLLEELTEVLGKGRAAAYEILCVDDASTDGSGQALTQLQSRIPHLRLIGLRCHAGQTAALAAGFDQARGQFIVTMDADLQNDPRDIPRLLEVLQQGYDVVSGWRVHRRDAWPRRLLSHAANWLLARLTGVPLHDSGCTLKLYRRDVLQPLVPYGAMHRILPAYLSALGGRIGECEVHHRSRRFGRSKYGVGRTMRVLLDIIAAAFVLRCSRTPIRVFGGIGFVCLGAGTLVSGWVAVRACWLGGEWISPLMFVAMTLAIAGVQFIALGLLGEMLLWTRATDVRHRTYAIEPPRTSREDVL